ncbi:hypothetical protein GE061_017640 [Apolygus lucorum]|uniref:Uncharacterized protein n=1 Tax=Apolygus lucorum TaxID=248454 RepID=A0A8S9XBL2_APOLU|nr:hypothetical protein GE061_017640 [Apolygus lucorum]
MGDHVVWADVVPDVFRGLMMMLQDVSLVLENKIGLIFILDISNSLLSALSVHEDLGKDAKTFSRNKPFACWLSVVVNFFAGGIIANFLLGEPILAFLTDPIQIRNIYVLTAAWWFVFHAPFDLGYKTVHAFPIRLILSIMKEIYRSHKVHGGVSQIGKLYRSKPNHLLMMVIGTIKGNGAAFMLIVERIIRGIWVPSPELLQPSFTSKLSFLASAMFVLNLKNQIIPEDSLIAIVAAVFVFFKVKSMLFEGFDLFAPFEKTFSYLFQGGIWETTRVDVKRKNVKNKKND